MYESPKPTCILLPGHHISTFIYHYTPLTVVLTLFYHIRDFVLTYQDRSIFCLGPGPSQPCYYFYLICLPFKQTRAFSPVAEIAFSLNSGSHIHACLGDIEAFRSNDPWDSRGKKQPPTPRGLPLNGCCCDPDTSNQHYPP